MDRPAGIGRLEFSLGAAALALAGCRAVCKDNGKGEAMFDIKKKKAFVCDLDGTLFMGPNPIAPAVDFVIRNTRAGGSASST